MRLRYLLLPLFATMTLASACGRRRSGPAPATPRTVLEVDNRSFVDMTVYVVNGSQRVRLGLAIGTTKTQLTIPVYVITGARMLRFLADPIGSNRTAVSDEIYVSPGDHVGLMIPP